MTRLLFARLCAAAALVALLGACSSPPEPSSPPTPKPNLVVLLVVDGLPQRQLTDYRDQLAPDGLARFLDRGTWFANAHYDHAFTVTGAGHATLLTGAHPDSTGIIGNDWRDPLTSELVYCASDASARYIGHPTQPLDGTSPKNLRVETVGDVLRRADPRAKVVAISGKDRGAILPAGKTGTAYMYMARSGQFASSSYYMAAHPDWVNTFNAAKPADRYFKTSWTPLLPESDGAAYARSVPDNQPWFARGGRLPMPMNAPDDEAPGPVFYSALLRSPFADALALDFARAAIIGEQLGQDDAPDILVVSLSGHDYVNHAFGAESRLSHDHLLQLDRLLQTFFQDLDARVGKNNHLVLLTADHGFMPAPEFSAAQGLATGRINLPALLGHVNAALTPQFGPGKWVSFSGSSLLVNRALLAQTGRGVDLVADAARRAIASVPGIAAAHTRAELLSGSASKAPYFAQMRKSWHPEVSGDVQFTIQPHWMVGTGYAATHGSPHAYDTGVPIAVYGPRWARPARVDERVAVVDIAPTLARWLQVAAPANAVGKLLPVQAP